MASLDVNDLQAVKDFLDGLQALMVEHGAHFDGGDPTLIVGNDNWVGQIRRKHASTEPDDWYFVLDTDGY